MNKFIEKLQDPKERKYFFALLGGKAIGVGLCFLLIFGASLYFNSSKSMRRVPPPRRRPPRRGSGCPATVLLLP